MSNEKYETPVIEALGSVLNKTRSGTAPNSDGGPFEDNPNDAFGPGDGTS